MQEQDTQTEWLRPQQAADYLTISLDTFYNACQVGGLQHVRVNGKRNIRTTRRWCDEWMLAKGVRNEPVQKV